MILSRFRLVACIFVKYPSVGIFSCFSLCRPPFARLLVGFRSLLDQIDDLNLPRKTLGMWMRVFVFELRAIELQEVFELTLFHRRGDVHSCSTLKKRYSIDCSRVLMKRIQN